MQTAARLVVVVSFAVTTAAASGCPEANDDPCAPISEDAQNADDGPEASYGGDGNDEVWIALYDAKDRAETTGDVATITVPANDQSFPKDGVAPTFSWESPLKIAAAAAPTTLFRPARRSLLERAFDAVTGVAVPRARAHEAPVSSDAYLVEIALPGEQCPATIVTTELSHTLDEALWARLKTTAGAPLTMRITSAYLKSGVVDEGPFRSADVTFHVE
jgi:hypothetical protein